MAYCPKCRKVVDERWIECPVCRTEVVPDERYARRDESRTLNKPPAVDSHRQYGFMERVEGVLKFDRRVFENIAIRQPFLEVVLLYVACTLISGFLPAGAYSGFFGVELPWPSDFFTLFGLGIMLAGILVAAYAIHLPLRILCGRESFTTTLSIMLYVSVTWSIVMNVVGLISGLLLKPLLGQIAASIVVDLLSIVFLLVVVAEWVVAFSVVHEITHATALVAVLTGMALFAVLSAGVYVAFSAGLDLLLAALTGAAALL